MQRPNYAAVEAAAARIAEQIVQTPLVPLADIGRDLQIDLWAKCENLQPTGSFKVRGATNAVRLLAEPDAARGVLTHSSGNHAAALARAAALRQIPAWIVMPENSLPNKIAAVRQFGTEPVFCAPTAEARERTAERLLAETGAVFIHPFDDPRVICGQGTVGLEILQQQPDVQTVVVPVGGGGLLSGCLIALKHQRPDIRVFAAEPAWADDTARSVRHGSRQPVERYDSIADGLRTPVGSITFPVIAEHVDDVLTVSESQIQEATERLLRQGRLVVEPSGAVALAAVVAFAERFRGRRTAVVISGGNLDWNQWPLFP